MIMSQVVEIKHKFSKYAEDYQGRTRVISGEIEGYHFGETLEFLEETIQYVMSVLDGLKFEEMSTFEKSFKAFNDKPNPFSIGISGSHVWIHQHFIFAPTRRVAIVKFEKVFS